MLTSLLARAWACAIVLWLACGGSAAASPQAVATLDIDEQGNVTAEYRLPPGTRTVRFKDAAADAARRQWLPAGSGLVMDGNAVSAVDGAEFTRLRLVIGRAQQSRLRSYDALVDFGAAGVAVYSSYLQLETPTTFVFGRPGYVRGKRMAAGAATEEKEAAYLYMGPLTSQRLAPGSILLDPRTPRWVAAEIGAALPKLARYYGKALGWNGPLRPNLMLVFTAVEQPGASYRGDVLPGQSIRLSLTGADWQVASEQRRLMLRQMLAHELFHIFERENDRDAGRPWIHEGMAEYAALRALRGTRLADEPFVVAALDDRINQCLARIGNRSLTAIEPTSSEQRLFYDCGTLAFALYDRYSQVQPGGAGSFFKAVAPALRMRGDAAADLMSALSSAAVPSAHAYIGQLLAAGRLDQGLALETITRELGLASTSGRHGNDVYARAVLHYLLANDCSGGRGYWTLPEGFRLDGRFNCKTVGASPTISHVFANDLREDAAQAYERIRQECGRAGATVPLTGPGDVRFSLACDKPIDAVPKAVHPSRLP